MEHVETGPTGQQQLDEDELKLDAEAEALLEELAASQAEVQRMLKLQKEQAQELGGLKEQLAAELQDLQDDAWKLQVFGELEALKRQLATLNSLEAELDVAEATLDAEEIQDGVQDKAVALLARADKALAAAEAGVGPLHGDDGTKDQEEGGDEDEDDDDGEYDPEAIAKLQAQLDAELASMYAQLQSVKNEAAAVGARKAALEAELAGLLAAQETGEDYVPGASLLMGGEGGDLSDALADKLGLGAASAVAEH